MLRHEPLHYAFLRLNTAPALVSSINVISGKRASQADLRVEQRPIRVASAACMDHL